MSSTRGRQVVIPLTNKSGGAVAAGDVVIVDTGNDAAFTTTTGARSEVSLGVVQEAIANNSAGRVLVAGYAALVNVPASVTRGHFIETHTVAKQATGNSARRSGSFGQFLTGGTTPTAWLWGQTDQTGSAGGTGQGLVDFASARRTSGDITCSADAVWTDVDTGLDLTLTATSGDWLEVGCSANCLDTPSVTLFLTAMTIVSASPVNDIATGTSPSNTTNGVVAWMVNLSVIGKAAGSILYQTVSGDISGGTVVLRLRYRTSNSTNRNLEADTNNPLHFWAKNLGPSM